MEDINSKDKVKMTIIRLVVLLMCALIIPVSIIA